MFKKKHETLKQPLSKTQAYPAHAVVSDILSSALKKRAEPAFISAKVCHASKSCSRGRFCAISYMLKKTSRRRSFSLRQQEVFSYSGFYIKTKAFPARPAHSAPVRGSRGRSAHFSRRIARNASAHAKTIRSAALTTRRTSKCCKRRWTKLWRGILRFSANKDKGLIPSWRRHESFFNI